jgi:ketosteroid isomerase-like protein
MALGHAHKVRSGEITELRDYALLSLRAWRSSEGEVEIDYDLVSAEEQPNPYYARKLEEAQSRLATLKAMKAEEAQLHSHDAHREAHAAWSEWTRERKARRARTQNMLTKLKTWQPPNPDLAELKQFMRAELETTLAHEIAETDPPKPARAAARKHLKEALEHAERDVAYYARKVEEEQTRVEQENEHLRALIASFRE